MTFSKAIKKMRRGKRVARSVWPDGCYMEIGKVYYDIILVKGGFRHYSVPLGLDDFEAEDWTELPGKARDKRKQP